MEPIKTEQHKGYTIKIHQDLNPEDPREWDNLGTMLCAHRRYALGDQHGLSPDQILREAQKKDTISIPLYLYDHSGLWMGTRNDVWPFNCPWDAGLVGYIVVNRAYARDQYGWKKISQRRATRIRRYLKAEVETYSQYLQGDVYGYEIEDKEGNCVDSCWGYYGLDSAIEAAKETLLCK